MSEVPKKMLVIDDEQAIQRLLRTALTPHGFEVREVSTGHEAVLLATSQRPDVIILDLGLPDISGMEVLKKLREWYERPIIILSVKNDEESIVSALDYGADDYLTKPFRIGELLARIRLVCRRTPLNADPVIKIGIFEIDIANHRFLTEKTEIKLTSTEFSLMAFLMKNPGRVVTHSQILKAIWGRSSSEQVQYIRVYIGHLRQKIEVDPSQPRYILTEPGVGYRFHDQ